MTNGYLSTIYIHCFIITKQSLEELVKQLGRYYRVSGPRALVKVVCRNPTACAGLVKRLLLLRRYSDSLR